MDSPVARVIAVKDGRATLSFEARPICPRCSEGKGCGAGLFTGMRDGREIDVTIPAGSALASGDRVTLELSDITLLRAAVFAYGLPLGGVIVALTLAWLARGPIPDWVAVMVAGAGLVAGCYLGRRSLRASACLNHLQARIVQGRRASV